MDESHILQKLQAIKSAKNQFVVKLTELNQLASLRTRLQHHLLDLTNKLKQLKSKQYLLQGTKINSQCEHFQLAKMQQQNYQEIGLSNCVITQIKEQIDEQQKQITKINHQITIFQKDKQTIQTKVEQRMLEKDKLNSGIQQIKANEESSISLHQKKLQMISKMRQTAEYFSNKLTQINNNKLLKQAQLQQYKNKADILQTDITLAQARLQSLLLNNNHQQASITQYQSEIQSQALRKKLLTEKFQILNERFYQMQIQQAEYRKLIEIKERKVVELRRRQSQRQMRWMEIRQKISIELQYVKYSCQKIVS